MWLIDEYPIILRILVWFNPIILPTKAEIQIIEVIYNDGLKFCNKITKGAIFCQVNISKQFIQDNPSNTSGNQAW